MNDSYQEAAKLLISLDPTIARKLLASLDNQERENIFFWINQLESVSSEESEKLISNFYHFYEESNNNSLENNFLKIIENTDPALIQRLLKKESPRAIALLILFLSQQTINKILMRMENNLFEEIITEAIELTPEEITQAKKTLEEKWGKIFVSPSSAKSIFIENCLRVLEGEKKLLFQKILPQEQLTR